MISFKGNHKSSLFNVSRKAVSCFIAFTFIFTSVLPPQIASAQFAPTILNLPVPGTMITPTAGFTPTLVRGITVFPENPLQFDFIVDTGDTSLDNEALRLEANKLIKYFLAALTVPENELWVNLSPYESNRIVPESFGVTEMGRDLLAQDYILKQLSASLMYPENELGQKFWSRVKEKALAKYGTSDIPMNTFNKIWIVPQDAVVYENGTTAFLIDSHLKIMLEEDYMALEQNQGKQQFGMQEITDEDAKIASGVSSEVVREILIPEIEKEVNEGETFANLRQIYNSMILATWFKMNLQQSLLGQVYMDQNKIKGVDVEDKQVKQKIYKQYVEAFEKGVYNYIKEDYDPATQEVIPRKYFSGGATMDRAAIRSVDRFSLSSLSPEIQGRSQDVMRQARDRAQLFTVDLLEANGDNASVVEETLAKPQTVTDAADLVKLTSEQLLRLGENYFGSILFVKRDIETKKRLLASLNVGGQDVSQEVEDSAGEYQSEIAELEAYLAFLEADQEAMNELKETFGKDLGRLDKRISQIENQRNSELEAERADTQRWTNGQTEDLKRRGFRPSSEWQKDLDLLERYKKIAEQQPDRAALATVPFSRVEQLAIQDEGLFVSSLLERAREALQSELQLQNNPTTAVDWASLDAEEGYNLAAEGRQSPQSWSRQIQDLEAIDTASSDDKAELTELKEVLSDEELNATRSQFKRSDFDTAASLEGMWENHPRWEGIVRPYSGADVMSLREEIAPGVDREDNTVAWEKSIELWALMQQGVNHASLGAMTGQQATQYMRAGLPWIYGSGWQIAAGLNSDDDMYPDLSIQPNDSPAKAVRLLNAHMRATSRATNAGDKSILRPKPIIIDVDAYYGSHKQAFKIVRQVIRAGAAGFHGEKQDACEKACGHLGDKVAETTGGFIRKKIAARLAADVEGVPTVIVGRTDDLDSTAVRAEAINDPLDREWIIGTTEDGTELTSAEAREKGFELFWDSDEEAITKAKAERGNKLWTPRTTSEGYYKLMKTGEKYNWGYAIATSLAFAPYVDVVWVETKDPDLDDARRYAEAIHAKYPGKPLAYNLSPSFNWRAKFAEKLEKKLDRKPTDAEIDKSLEDFITGLGNLGYRISFVTLAGFHAQNKQTYELARAYRREGMRAYSQLQEAEFGLQPDGFNAVKHQDESGLAFWGKVDSVVGSSREIEGGSTEADQFTTAETLTKEGLDETTPDAAELSSALLREIYLEGDPNVIEDLILAADRALGDERKAGTNWDELSSDDEKELREEQKRKPISEWLAQLKALESRYREITGHEYGEYVDSAALVEGNIAELTLPTTIKQKDGLRAEVGIDIAEKYTGEVGSGKIDNPRSRQMIATLAENFTAKYKELMRNRHERLAAMERGEVVPGGRGDVEMDMEITDSNGNKATVKEILDGDWKVEEMPEPLTRAGGILTGPWTPTMGLSAVMGRTISENDRTLYNNVLDAMQKELPAGLIAQIKTVQMKKPDGDIATTEEKIAYVQSKLKSIQDTLVKTEKVVPVRIFADLQDAVRAHGDGTLEGPQTISNIVNNNQPEIVRRRDGKVYKRPPTEELPVITTRIADFDVQNRHMTYKGNDIPDVMTSLVYAIESIYDGLKDNPNQSYSLVLPKTENPEEVVFVIQMKRFIEAQMGIEKPIPLIFMNETNESSLKLELMLWSGRDDFKITNVGRWDKGAADMRTFWYWANKVYGDLGKVGMDKTIMDFYVRHNLVVAKKRGLLPEGGMVTKMPSEGNKTPADDQKAIESIVVDKMYEWLLGYNYAWVASPAYLPLVQVLFQQPREFEAVLEDLPYEETVKKLLEFPNVPLTREGIYADIYEDITYGFGTRNTGMAVSIDSLSDDTRGMFDGATGKKTNYHLWMLARAGVTLETGESVTVELITEIIDQVMKDWGKRYAQFVPESELELARHMTLANINSRHMVLWEKDPKYRIMDMKDDVEAAKAEYDRLLEEYNKEQDLIFDPVIFDKSILTAIYWADLGEVRKILLNAEVKNADEVISVINNQIRNQPRSVINFESVDQLVDRFSSLAVINTTPGVREQLAQLGSIDAAAFDLEFVEGEVEYTPVDRNTFETQFGKDLDINNTRDQERYFSSVISLLYQRALLTDELQIAREETFPNIFRTFLENDVRKYTKSANAEALEESFEVGDFVGQRRVIGSKYNRDDKRIFHLEFWRRGGEDQKVVLTFRENRDGSTSFRVIPKKNVLIYGHGTIASKIAHELNKLGFSVVAANRSPNKNATLARYAGYPTVPLNAEGIKAYEEAGFPILRDAEGNPVTADSYLQGKPGLPKVDLIVEGLDGKQSVIVGADGKPVVGEDGKVLRSQDGKKQKNVANSLIYKTEVFDRYDVPVLYQGSNKPELVADGFVSETGGLEQAGLSFSRFQDQKDIFCPSCNTTTQVTLLTPILASDEIHPGSVKVDMFTIRRSADPGQSKSGVPADGFAVIETGYHHAEDALAFFNQKFEEIAGKLSDRFALREEGEIAYQTDATMGPQTKFHVARGVIRARKTDGTPLTATDVKRIIMKNPRVALIKTGDGRFDPTVVYDTLMNQMQKFHPYIMPVYVEQRDTGGVNIIALTPQESNVIPNNVSTSLLRLGVVKDVGIANNETNISMRLHLIKEMFEGFLPDDEIAALEREFGVQAADAAEVVETKIGVLAQRITRESKAATGQLNGKAAIRAGANGAIAGHSETRINLGDTDAMIADQLLLAHELGLTTKILAFGESLEIRELNVQKTFVFNQIKEGLKLLNREQIADTILAYEPIWAIGTGLVATVDQVQEMASFIRGIVAELTDQETAEKVRILYGGSVTKDTAAALIALEDVDGFLVGGASNDSPSIMPIINAAAAQGPTNGRIPYVGGNNKTKKIPDGFYSDIAEELDAMDIARVEVGFAPSVALITEAASAFRTADAAQLFATKIDETVGLVSGLLNAVVVPLNSSLGKSVADWKERMVREISLLSENAKTIRGGVEIPFALLRQTLTRVTALSQGEILSTDSEDLLAFPRSSHWLGNRLDGSPDSTSVVESIQSRFAELLIALDGINFQEVAGNVAPSGSTENMAPVTDDVDRAAIQPTKEASPVGGIDLDPAMLDLQIIRDANGIALPMFQQPIGTMNIEGFLPIIINIRPIQNLPLLLGMVDSEESPVNIGYDDQQQPFEATGRFRARKPEQVSYLN